MDVPRRTVAFITLFFFLFYVLLQGLGYRPIDSLVDGDHDLNKGPPDFSRYIHKKTVSADELGLDDPNRRVIMIGDIHGMNNSLHSLLTTVSYNPQADTLFHLGDVLQKGPMEGTLAVLDYLTSANTHGVRGNHDQTVIQWRTWIEWIEGMNGGKEWLKEMDRKWADDNLSKDDKKGKWWNKIPKGWLMLGVHYRIAREMSEENYKYLLSLPLILHVPSQHLYLAHGGVLPYDPTRPVDHPKQPLAHLPTLSSRIFGKHKRDDEVLRVAQEEALLTKVPQNKDPWVILNMRGVTGSGKISRKSGKGTPWAKLWNKTIGHCSGFDVHVTKKKDEELPCMPATVVYGHTASRGLDVKRWSMGLDSGCSHGKRLTALVVSGTDSNKSQSLNLIEKRSDVLDVQTQDTYSAVFDLHPLRDDSDNRDDEDDDDPDYEDGEDEDDDDEEDESKPPKDSTIPFGDDGVAQLFSVKCHN